MEDKLRSLMEGLKCENIDKFIREAEVEDYKLLGHVYYSVSRDNANKLKKK